MKGLLPLVNILRGAVKKEVEAFNYYRTASRSSPFEETKALLIQLAEEERKHRLALLQEITTLHRFAQSEGKELFGSTEVIYPLPKVLPIQRFHYPQVEVVSLSLPGVFMGGDYFHSFPWRGKEGDSALLIMLFDVMGHGLKATKLKAILTEEIGGLLEDSTPEDWVENFSPANLLGRLNKVLSEQGKEELTFVTLFAGLLHRDILWYGSAGHEPPFLLTPRGEVRSLTETQFPLGIEGATTYRERNIKLHPGETLLLFSDGLIEAEDGKGQAYGRERLGKILQRCKRLRPDALIEKVIDSLGEFLGGRPLSDELTLAAIRLTRRKVKAPLGNKE